ncbi:unnamed protein product [Peniophora sp. CBMAI 1063]|nr:unnamed protein product [Peniophora sp. CBMAI 1063]
MMIRAGDHPLTLRLRHPSLTVEDLDFALKHLDKARVFDIDESACKQEHDPWILEPAEFSQRTFPALEEMSLYLKGAHAEQHTLLTPDIWELPAATTPLLKRLSLKAPLIFLAYCDRELELSYAVPTFPLQPNAGVQPVKLPVLEHLRVGTNANVGIGFWNHITVPSSCTVVLDLYEIDQDYPDFLSHLQAIPSRLGGTAFDALIVGLSVWDTKADADDEGATTYGDATVCWLVSDTGYENNAWTGPFRRDYRERMSVYMYDIEITEPHFVRLMAQSLTVVDAGRIEVLEIGSHLAYDAQRWSRVISPFNNLHTLYLEDMPRTPLLLSLDSATSIERQDFASIVLPALRFLWLQELDLTEESDGEIPEGPNRVQFTRMLLSRKQQGFPVHHLRIGELYMDTKLAEKSFLPRIRAIVPLVECDTIIPDKHSGNGS